MRKFKKVSFGQFLCDFKAEFPNFVDDIKEIYEDTPKPKRATLYSAGYDFFSPIGFTLEPGESIKIPTAMRVFLGDDNVLFVLPRSGQGFKYFVRLANTEGVIDADYVKAANQGHIWLKIRNEGDKTFSVKKGEAICQAIFQEYLLTDDDELEEKAIRQGGLGSTSEF